MDLQKLQETWNRLGEEDPMWAILTDPGKRGSRWNPQEFFETGHKEVAQAVDYVSDRVRELRRGRALDFGCGVGRCTLALADHFGEVVGVDIAPSMIELANRFNSRGERCTYRANERDDLSLFDDETFDFVYSHLVFQHMRPELAESYIREFVRLLSPGGVAYFQLPSMRWLRRVAGRLLPVEWIHWRLRHGSAPPWPMYGQSVEDVERTVEDPGGRVLDVTSAPLSGGRWWTDHWYLVMKIPPSTSHSHV